MDDTRVLVVEDDPASLKLLGLVLSMDGLSVESATDADTALRTMRERAPHLVVADIQLPRMSGLEFARAVRANPAWDNVLLVAVSAHATKVDARRARSAGYAELIPKPIDTRSVSNRIKNLLARHTATHRGHGRGNTHV